jgi:DNA-binding Lrp family transcriptional regulator
MKLDKIDRRILHELQEDGRMTNVELASRAGISAPPCLRRVRALEDQGLIRGFHARIDRAAMGYGITVFAQVKLNSHADTDLRSFGQAMDALAQVRESWMIAGDNDYMLKVVAKDWESYQAFLTEKLTTLPNVAAVKSTLTIKPTKEMPGIPIDVD